MTQQEFYEKYGQVKVKFLRYYKYTFTYYAILPDGSELTCSYGGNADDIYRHEVSVTKEESVINLEPYSGRIYKDKQEIESFYEYQ